MKTFGKICLVISVVTLLAGCNKKIKKVVEWDITYTSDHVIKDTLKGWQSRDYTTRVESDIQSRLDAYDTRAEFVGEAICTRVTVDVKGPASKDLHGLEHVMIKLDATRQAEASLGSRWNTGNDTIKPLVKSIDLKANEPNLKNHIMEPFFDVKMSVMSYSNIPPGAPNMTLTTTFTVHVKGINQ